MEEPKYLTTGEVASLFRVDMKTVDRWAKAGRITGVKTPGGHWRFSASHIKRVVEEQQR